MSAQSFCGFRWAITHNQSEVISYYFEILPHLKLEMIRANNYDAFRWSARYGNVKLISFCISQFQHEEQLTVIGSVNYCAFLSADPRQEFRILG